jgi:predicted acetylornithine/succinylornithine family transaminase
MPTYSRSDLTVVKGKGSYVWDEKNKKYLDFFPGWAVSALGHCHPNVIKNASRQLKDIIHVPNNYYNTKQAKLAKVIIDNSFDGKVFFGNSGAEAIEAAIKLARYYGYPKRHQIISMAQSFHGRTLAALSLTGQSKYKKGFKPLPSGFKHVEFNNFKALKKAVNKKTVAIVIEPIQGEGGINVADKQYLKKVRKLCNEKDILLIFDEIQTGMGRTGKMFAYQHYGVTPDAMTLAKALGGGFPISCLVASKKVCDVLGAGSHATTFGGSPIVCSASLGVFEAIKKEKLLKNVNKVAPYLLKKLNSLKQKYPDIIEKIKGIGLMIGIDLKCKGSRIVGIAKDNGLLINCTQENTLRMLPPLIINKKDVDKAVEILDKSIGKFKDEPR